MSPITRNARLILMLAVVAVLASIYGGIGHP
jgi:hypothetical protein